MQHRDRLHAPPVRSRIAAGGALAFSAITLAALAVFTVENLPALVASLLVCIVSKTISSALRHHAAIDADSVKVTDTERSASAAPGVVSVRNDLAVTG